MANSDYTIYTEAIQTLICPKHCQSNNLRFLSVNMSQTQNTMMAPRIFLTDGGRHSGGSTDANLVAPGGEIWLF
jgi:hypothetical protein